MSLSLDKVQKRQKKKVAKHQAAKQSKSATSARPWEAHRPTQAPLKPEATYAPPQSRAAQFRSWLEKPKTLKLLGLSLEIGSQVRLHLPPLHSEKTRKRR